MKIKDIKGLKYPDEYFIKYFFKNSFSSKENLLFAEFGCGNGNNLTLAYEYGFEVLGVDINESAIEDANYNFNKIKTDTKFEFYLCEMIDFAKENKDLQIDVLLLPNVVNYIKKEQLLEFFNMMLLNNNIKKEASFFIRCRELKDFRFGIGENLGENTYLMPKDYDITSEASCINKFYSEYELIEMLKKSLNLKEYFVFHNEFQNLQKNNTLVFNADIILWGVIN